MEYESMCLMLKCAVFQPFKLKGGVHLLTCCLGLRTSLRPIIDMLSKFLRPIIDMLSKFLRPIIYMLSESLRPIIDTLSEFADFCLANYGNVIGCLMGRG